MDAQRRQQGHARAQQAEPAPDSEVLRLISEVEGHLQGLKRVHAEREQTKAALDERQGRLDALTAEQKKLQEQIAARQEEIRRADEAMHAQQALLQQRQAEAQRLAADAAALEKESKDRLARAAQERHTVEAMAADLGAREKALADRTARMDQLQAEVRALKHRLAETERTSAERAEELLRCQDEAADLARRLQESEHQRPAAERQAAALKAELDKAMQAASAAGAEANADRQRAADLAERCRTLEQSLAEQERQQAHSAESAADVQSRLAAAADALAKVAAERDGLREDLARQQQLSAAAQERLAGAARDVEQAAAARDAINASLQKAQAESSELASRGAALQAQIDGLRRQAAARATAADGQSRLRRQRMQRCRLLLRERSGKIRQASEMLKARHQQYEQVLSLRGEVITAKRAVDSLAKKVQTASARTRAAAAVFYLAGLIAVLGALSWAITRQMVPATYVARAVVVADARNKTLSDADLAAWQSYHETLLGDPQFLESAAERMGRRGIATLATPGDLKAELDKSFDSQSAQNGQLVLELRGLGADRTQRVLDTYVTALVSQANAAKEHRSDGAATTILEPARCAPTPVKDPRPLYAAGLLGGSTVVFLLIGGLVWGRLAAAKQKFETEARIDEFVESPDWPAANAAG